MCTKNYNLVKYGVRQTNFFGILGPFTPLPPQWSQKSKFWKNKKKMSGYIIFLYIHAYHNWRSYDIWFLKYKVQQTQIFIILHHFLSFLPLENLEYQNFNIKKTPGGIIILHICSINDNHMMYGSWDMEGKRQLFVILDCFLSFCPAPPLSPLPPPTPMDPKNQNFEKKPLKILSFFKHKWQSYDLWLLRYGVQLMFYDFGLLALLPP